MKFSIPFGVALFATSLVAGEVDPRIFRLIGPDTKFVNAVDVERYQASQFAQLVPLDRECFDCPRPAARGREPRFVMTVWDSAGRMLQAKIGGSLDARDEAEDAIVTIHRGVRIVSTGERAAAQIDSQTLLEGDQKFVLEALDRWSRNDLPLSEAAAKAQRLAQSYDAWFLGIRPLDLPRPQQSQSPLKYREELVKAIDEVRAGIRFGSMVEAMVEADVKSAEEAGALAVIGRYLPGLIELKDANPQAALMEMADRLTSVAEGRTAVLRLSVAASKLEEWFRAEAEKRELEQ